MEKFDNRLKRYKKALEFLTERLSHDPRYNHGICFALVCGDADGKGKSGFNKKYPNSLTKMQRQYPEIYKRRPYVDCYGDKLTGGFWWDFTKTGHNYRIKLLKDAIAEMEALPEDKRK